MLDCVDCVDRSISRASSVVQYGQNVYLCVEYGPANQPSVQVNRPRPHALGSIHYHVFVVLNDSMFYLYMKTLSNQSWYWPSKVLCDKQWFWVLFLLGRWLECETRSLHLHQQFTHNSHHSYVRRIWLSSLNDDKVLEILVWKWSAFIWKNVLQNLIKVLYEHQLHVHTCTYLPFLNIFCSWE